MNLSFISISLIMSLLLATVAHAQSTTDEPSLATGDLLYGLKTASERIQLAFTFNKAGKAELRLRHAQERLREVEKLIRLNRIEHAERARKAHEDTIAEVERDVGSLTEDEKVKYAERLSAIREKHGKNVEALTRIIARFEKDDNPNNDKAIASLKENVARSMIRQVEVQKVEESALNLSRSRTRQRSVN